MTKRIYILSIFLIVFASAKAQTDTLLELGSNHTIGNYFHNNYSLKKQPVNNKALLTLPFFDDFSQNHIYPDQNLWQDINVHVNSNFADNPITYGVATFDGLDSTGYPYNFGNPTSWGPADTLTSHPIDLTTVIDSVFLSFFYQPQGNGNKPETKDSISLQFFRKSDSTWVRMWGTPGTPLEPFKRVMLPVDTSFHNDEFQFRFMNWATLSGNVDHWNLDYIYLNENRNYLDTVVRDVSFITNHHNMLSEFTSMPWSHYLVDSLNYMKPALDVTYKNNDTTDHDVFYKYQVIDNNGAGPVIETYPSGTSQKNVLGHSSLIEPQAVYNISPTFINDFYYPPETTTNKVFQIKNYFHLQPFIDDHVENDTVLSYQVFGSYYAYDDGSAEVGYGVQGIGSKLAHEFNIKKSDTVTAFQIYFTPLQNNHSGESVRLKIWSSLNPEVEVYTQPASLYMSPIYSNTNEFLNYNLDAPVYLSAGTYYFGWEKISSEFLNVGWDVNNNNQSKVHFNSVGVWQTASFPGTLMLRPVFGKAGDPQVSVKEFEKETIFEVYPNPAKSIINFQISDENNYHIQLIDISGKLMIETESSISKALNIESISNGIYLIKFTNHNSNQTTFKKVIISK